MESAALTFVCSEGQAVAINPALRLATFSARLRGRAGGRHLAAAAAFTY